MSWDKKEDYCGLEVEKKLICKASNQNRGLQTLEKNGRLGQIAATRYFADVGAPSCDYTVAAALELAALKLGAITVVDGRNYALQSISVKTSAGAEPTFSATSQQVEDAATKANANTFDVPELSLSPDEIAQFLFGAFTLADDVEEGEPATATCELTECGAEISCTVGTSKVNGYPVASDVTGGKIVVSLTIGQYGTVKPKVTPADGWKLSSALTCSDPDSDMPTWTCALSKPLVKTMATATQNAAAQGTDAQNG